MNQKGFIPTLFIVGVLVLCIILAISLLYLKKPSPKTKALLPSQEATTALLKSVSPSPTQPTVFNTTDWKSYTDTEGSFLLSYPSFYTLHIDELSSFESPFKPTKNALELEDSKAPNAIPSDYPYDIKVTFENVPGGSNVEELSTKDNICDPSLVTSNELLKRAVITVDKGQAVVCEQGGAGGYDAVSDILVGTRFYHVFIPSSGDSYLPFLKVFLSTFIFQ